ncbi:class I SAM-dependent methyltransferase [Helicobacter rodentium]|uniref:class I SAM-dependent methyltransferase n=1 Tax=Helicobacter rodentium TaxID=59617 RepID=UPI0025A4CF15|nr:class I SAM-dependent methyltransferase [Helicobacter rodentium]
MIENIFKSKIQFQGNFVNLLKTIGADNQAQTAEAFSEKWVSYAENTDEKEQKKLWDYQKEWYLKLYGFKDEKDLAHFLSQCEYVFDAGCGLGYLSEWFAALSPKTKIIAMDISDSVCVAAERYKEIPNIYFMKGDIANTPFKDNAIDYVSCHAVIMHTENPEVTFRELSRILKPSSASGGGDFPAIFMQKKLCRAS